MLKSKASRMRSVGKSMKMNKPRSGKKSSKDAISGLDFSINL